jgi:hypothetical protein
MGEEFEQRFSKVEDPRTRTTWRRRNVTCLWRMPWNEIDSKVELKPSHKIERCVRKTTEIHMTFICQLEGAAGKGYGQVIAGGSEERCIWTEH